jgi:DMSO/TMAO reductase YedYZ molybdopterin-dependent catalytic subunit
VDARTKSGHDEVVRASYIDAMADDPDYESLFKGKPGSVLGEHRAADPKPAPEREKLVAAKERWAAEKREPQLKPRPWQKEGRRLPPGQELTRDFPILDLGNRPLVDTRDWRLTIAGAVERPIDWDWNAFQGAPQTEVKCDIHCVTQWSRFDNVWRGVAGKTLMEIVRPRAGAKFLVFHSHDGYTTNLPIERFAADDALLAHSWQGEPLAREHGGPVRAVVASLYFWKSAKWVKHIAVFDRDVPGFWETRGYHNEGDPWKQQRYG